MSSSVSLPKATHLRFSIASNLPDTVFASRPLNRFGQATEGLETLEKPLINLVAHGKTAPMPTPSLKALNQQTKEILKRLPQKDKLLTGLLHLKEQPESFSAVKFIQDTGILWVPKSLVSRSLTEWFEVSFTEFIESAYFYFAAPLSAQKGFAKWYHDIAKHKPDPKLLRTAIEDVPKESLKAVLPLKTAVVLSSVGAVSVAGEYALNFVKNLITAKGLHQTNFSDVVALSKRDKKHRSEVHPPSDPAENDPQNKAVIRKAHRRIAQCLGFSAILLGASVFLARKGAELPALEKPLYQFVKRFDFNYGNPRKFGLTAQQLRWLIMPLAVTGYIDAARDKLERWEVTPRAILSGFYLAKGADMLENRILTEGRKRVPHLFDAKGHPKAINTIVHDTLLKSRATLETLAKETGKPVTEEAVYQLSIANLRKDLTAKNMLFYPQYLFGIGVIGLAVALLNRHLTRERFERGFGAKTLTTTSPQQALTPNISQNSSTPQKASAYAGDKNQGTQKLLYTTPDKQALNQVHLGTLQPIS